METDDANSAAFLVRLSSDGNESKTKPVSDAEVEAISRQESAIREQIAIVDSQLQAADAEMLRHERDLAQTHPRFVLCARGCAKCTAFVAWVLQHKETVQELWYQRTQLQLLGVNTTLKRQGLDGKYQITAGAGMVPEPLRTKEFLRKYHASLQKATDHARPLKQCAVCSMVDKLKRCGRCGFVYYCGEAHQRAHLAVHRELCLAMAANSTVVCSMCQTRVNVWHPGAVWASGASAAKIEFACLGCRKEEARFPRAVFALCGSFLPRDHWQAKLAEYTTATQMAMLVCL